MGRFQIDVGPSSIAMPNQHHRQYRGRSFGIVPSANNNYSGGAQKRTSCVSWKIWSGKAFTPTVQEYGPAIRAAKASANGEVTMFAGHPRGGGFSIPTSNSTPPGGLLVYSYVKGEDDGFPRTISCLTLRYYSALLLVAVLCAAELRAEASFLSAERRFPSGRRKTVASCFRKRQGPQGG